MHVTDTAFDARDTDPARTRPVGGAGKRLFDICFSILAIVATAPLMLVVAIAISVISPGPVLFSHRRIGYGGAAFPCLKFRTMRVDAAERLAEILASDPAARAEYSQTHKLRRDPRIVPGIGHLLRKTSLDELPQFFNVLVGQMSVVGPRPVTPDELVRYGRQGRQYLAAKPGVTGLWQVSGRSELGFGRRIALDVSYVANWSAIEDIRIILRTLVVLLRREGAY